MKIIETKRHPLKFYTTLIFGFLFFFALGSFIIFIGIDELPDNKNIMMIFFGSLICFFAIWMVYSYWKNSPKIIIDKHNLKIGNETFSLKSIKDVALTCKMPFRFIISFPMEGTAILFNDGSNKILFDDMYANSYEVKSFLEQVIIKKQKFNPIVLKKINSSEIQFNQIEIFKGNQLTSLRGISLWGLILFFAFSIIIKWTNPPIGLLIFFGLFSTFWLIIHSWLMHYFELTKNFLIIRNHNFIWKKIIYHFSDIKEVVFETH